MDEPNRKYQWLHKQQKEKKSVFLVKWLKFIWVRVEIYSN